MRADLSVQVFFSCPLRLLASITATSASPFDLFTRRFIPHMSRWMLLYLPTLIYFNQIGVAVHLSRILMLPNITMLLSRTLLLDIAKILPSM